MAAKGSVWSAHGEEAAVHAVQITATGGPEVLTWVTLPDPEPGPGQLAVDVTAAGVNFVDTYQRTGLYAVALPRVLGEEGSGVVRAVGDGVPDFAAGDIVAWGNAPGSYAEQAVVPAAHAVRVPRGVPADVAAAAMLQGMTAHYLVHDCYPVGAGTRCLVHAAAGGVGLLLVQFAKLLGAEVFGTVGSDEKAELARAAGADHVVLYTERDFGSAVETVAGPRPIDVVFDGVGRTTFVRGLEVLRRRGTMISFGNASGPVEPISPLVLSANGSLTLIRPRLTDYIVTTDELRARAGWVLDRVADGSVSVRIGATLPLRDAEEAHRLLEGRATTGKVLLVP